MVNQLISGMVIEEPKNLSITFDNFFTSYPLKERGFAATHTLRENRLAGCPLPKSTSFKKECRGAIDFSSDGDVTVVAWNDNKPIYLASNHISVHPITNKRRYSQKEKKHVK